MCRDGSPVTAGVRWPPDQRSVETVLVRPQPPGRSLHLNPHEQPTIHNPSSTYSSLPNYGWWVSCFMQLKPEVFAMLKLLKLEPYI